MEAPAAKRVCTTVEQEASPAYFAGTPADFQAAADVVLQLRGGAHLPAHSQLLASTSPILCDLLKLAASQASTGSKAVIPQPDARYTAGHLSRNELQGAARQVSGLRCCSACCKCAASNSAAAVGSQV